ncbi:type II secretion system F family protein [Oryzobacter telluris]|uniref:type II secretion system F family protein n=1 Tax=Oryzobacter telluris TaxID=3149179 RepID=UPI00370D8BC8
MTAVAAVLVVLSALVLPGRPGSWLPARARARASDLGPSTVEDAAAALALVAATLRGGAGAVESLEQVARVVDGAAGHELAVVAAAHRWGEPPDRAWTHVGDGWAAAAVAWHAAQEAGAAPAGLLAAAASRMREEERRRLEEAVQRSGVLLVLPLGLCFLPGFVATTVAPVVLHLVGSVLA